MLEAGKPARQTELSDEVDKVYPTINIEQIKEVVVAFVKDIVRSFSYGIYGITIISYADDAEMYSRDWFVGKILKVVDHPESDHLHILNVANSHI